MKTLELEEAILFFAKSFNKHDSYTALIKSHTVFPSLVKMIINDMFLNEFNNTTCTQEELIMYHRILMYSRVMAKDGYFEFD